jgi:hypothetical protein
MRKSTFLNGLLFGIASVALVCAPTTALGQHAGGGHGGGGGGGFHGGGGGGFHGGGYGGRGGSYGGGSYEGRGSYGSMHGASPSGRSSAAARPWSFEGREAAHDTSPGWHSFGSGNSAGMAGRSSSGAMAGRSGTGAAAGRSAAGRSATGRSAAGASAGRSVGAASASHAAIADGQWHSFGSAQGRAGSAQTSNPRSVQSATLNRGGLGFRNSAWRGGFGFRGGYGGFGWGCCGWGLGWGWGFGWGWGWGPFWDWSPYWYNPWWDYGYSAAYIYPNTDDANMD